MMGSELHLHVTTESGEHLIARVPTISMTEAERAALVYGATLYLTFPGKAMYFFDPEKEVSLVD